MNPGAVPFGPCREGSPPGDPAHIRRGWTGHPRMQQLRLLECPESTRQGSSSKRTSRLHTQCCLPPRRCAQAIGLVGCSPLHEFGPRISVGVQLVTRTGSVSHLIHTGGLFRLVEIHRQATILKVTIDSTESLEDAVRVLGAMYNVTLVVSSPEEKTSASAKRSPRTATARSGNAGTRSRTPKKQRIKPPTTESAHSNGNRASTSELRSWAREHGFSVSGRGRIPASIRAAYDQANNN